MPKTWRLQSGSDVLIIKRRSDLAKNDGPAVNPSSFTTSLDRWFADPLSRKAVLDMYESTGSHSLQPGRTSSKILASTVKPQLEKAFQRGDLVALRVAPPPTIVAGLPSAPPTPPSPASASVKPVKPAAALAKAKLRVVLIDKDGKAISGKAWELLSPVRAIGKTGGNGLIEVENLSLENASGSLNIDMGPAEKKKTAPAPRPAAPPVSGPPPYPTPIKADDFKDKNKDHPTSGGDQTIVKWSLSLRLLKDMESDVGIKERLHNLGFNCDAKSDGAATAKAVKAYQRFYQKKEAPSGRLADIQSDVKNRHDKL